MLRNTNFIKFCTWICTTYTAEQLEELPQDEDGFINFVLLYKNSKLLKDFEYSLKPKEKKNTLDLLEFKEHINKTIK